MASLKSSDIGPIAKSYDELQGIPYLEDAFSKGGQELAPPALLVRTLLQCSELAYFNCADLSRRAASQLRRRRLAEVLEETNWLVEVLRLVVRITSYAASVNERELLSKVVFEG